MRKFWLHIFMLVLIFFFFLLNMDVSFNNIVSFQNFISFWVGPKILHLNLIELSFPIISFNFW